MPCQRTMNVAPRLFIKEIYVKLDAALSYRPIIFWGRGGNEHTNNALQEMKYISRGVKL